METLFYELERKFQLTVMDNKLISVRTKMIEVLLYMYPHQACKIVWRQCLL